MEHGTQKLSGFLADRPARGEDCSALRRCRHASEVVGGIAAAASDLFTRPVAFILSGEMAFAYWMSHAPRSFFPLLNGGDASILYCFLFLDHGLRGGGAWSHDRAIAEDGLDACRALSGPLF